MAYTSWAATTAKSVGDVVRATTQTGFGFVFRCIVAGTTGSTEPVWPTKLYKTDDGTSLEGYVVDGTVTWAAVSTVSEELQKINPSAVIELFELALVSGLHYNPSSPPTTTTYRFHAGTNELSGDLVWAGNTYSRFPVQADGFEYSGTGQLPTPRISVANLNGLLTLALLDVNAYTPGNDLINAKVTRIRTLKKYLDASNFTGGTNATADPYAEFPREVYFISRKTTENRNVIEWELASVFDMRGVRLPKRQATQKCQWIYKSAECSYSGSLATCTKTLEACEEHFGTNKKLPFGGFPGVGQIT
jgi:lambda family phage minor tail protein L